MQKSMEVLFLGFWWLWCSYTIISWQNRTNGVNQLPRLSRRWVPGIPMGFHCGQPAPTDRILPPWLANPHNQATSPHFSHPSHWRSSRRKKNKGWEGGGGRRESNHSTDCPTNAQQRTPCSVQSYHIPWKIFHHWMLCGYHKGGVVRQSNGLTWAIIGIIM